MLEIDLGLYSDFSVNKISVEINENCDIFFQSLLLFFFPVDSHCERIYMDIFL